MRPRRLRRLLALMASGAVFAGTGLGFAAKADAQDPVYQYAQVVAPAVCTVLDDFPVFNGINGVADGIVADTGWGYREAGQVIGWAVANVCPEHQPLLLRYIRTYEPPQSQGTRI